MTNPEPRAKMRGPQLFPATSWTLVALCVGEGTQARDARNRFAERYYRPVQAMVRHLVWDPEDVDEVVGSFFAEKVPTLTAKADASRGKFRVYLRVALKRFVFDHWRKKLRDKGGGGKASGEEIKFEHPDQDGRGWDHIEGAPPPDDEYERAFDVAWIRMHVERAQTLTEQECLATGQKLHYELFEGHHFHGMRWPELGRSHSLSGRQAEHLADTANRKFRRYLRQSISEDLPPGAVVDDEVRDLLRAL